MIYEKKTQKLSVLTWLKILKKISLVIHQIYARELLHNALHMQNIFIRDKSHAKVIDFCKACLVSDPIIYNIKAGFTKQAKYLKIHKPLASELRKITGNVVSIETDVR